MTDQKVPQKETTEQKRAFIEESKKNFLDTVQSLLKKEISPEEAKKRLRK